MNIDVCESSKLIFKLTIIRLIVEKERKNMSKCSIQLQIDCDKKGPLNFHLVKDSLNAITI